MTEPRPVLLGLDPAPSNLGWATVHADTGQPLATGRVTIPTTGPVTRHIYQAIREVVAQVWPDNIEYWQREEPKSRFPKAIKAHGYVCALVDHACDTAPGIRHATCLAILDGRPHGLEPWEWRRLIGLPGNVPKHEVMAWACGNATPHGLLIRSQDAADALAIARAAWLQLQDRQEDQSV